MTWQGINRGITSVSEDMGASEYQQNTRMTVRGELQRRPGMAPANFSPQGTAALGMVGAFPTSGPYGMIVDTAGTVNGFPITMPIWQPPQLKPPIPQIVAQGTPWRYYTDTALLTGTVGLDGGSTRTIMLAGGTCGGTLQLTRISPGPAIAHLNQINIIKLGGAWVAPVPSDSYGHTSWSGAVPYDPGFNIAVYLSINPGARYIIDTISTAGCNRRWLLPVTAFSTTVGENWGANGTSTGTLYPSGILRCACAGIIDVSFGTVLAVGAVASVWRHDGAGTTSPIDTRPIIGGQSYSVSVPSSAASNGLEQIAFGISNISGGRVDGSVVGASLVACNDA